MVPLGTALARSDLTGARCCPARARTRATGGLAARSPRGGRSWRPDLSQTAARALNSHRATEVATSCTCVRKADIMSEFRTTSNPRREAARGYPERCAQDAMSNRLSAGTTGSSVCGRDRCLRLRIRVVSCNSPLVPCGVLGCRCELGKHYFAPTCTPTRLPSRFCTPGHRGHPSREVPAPGRWWVRLSPERPNG